MTAEQSLILGVGLIAFLVWNLAQRFEEQRDQIHKSLLALSTFFIIGMEYTALGIAQNQGFDNAVTAYTFSIVLTVIMLLAMIYRIYKQIKDEAQSSSSMEGLTQ